MVTIKDIAKAAGVSPSTVSRALNDSPLIRESTKERIKRLAAELGYERNELARSLVKGRTRALGLLVPDITNPFFAEIVKGVEDTAHARGYGVILCNTGDDPEKERDYGLLLRRKRVDGQIITSVALEDPLLSELQRAEIPFVLVSRTSHTVDAPYVIVDDRLGARLAVEHLISLGHKRIACISGPKGTEPGHVRAEAFREVLSGNGIRVPRSWVKHTDFTWEAGEEAAREFLSRRRRPTAIFAANDLIALGVLVAAHNLGIAVPEELSVVGFDNIAYASLPLIELTTVAQPTYRMGRLAAEWLIDVLEGKRRKKLRKLLRPELVVRKTTAPPP
ncbi:MAG TPA: LacI family transcriptional regulator [Candidatus Acetothermia bacterium]|nr:MAG: LacI family transcriptional regulator [Candidatus Acetothermia bacterium]HDC92532.1 LacI family transcriptional regulator [Candidatus Acetothermia bacterium]